MSSLKITILTLGLLLLFTGCIPQGNQNLEIDINKKKSNYLIETKDINNIKELEVSNNLIQVLPVISISGVQVLVDDKIKDEKLILFRNEKCIFMGMASADLTGEKIKVKITKATCRTKFSHKVNYEVNAWVLDEDENFALKASKEILNKNDDDKVNEKVLLKIKKGQYAYLSFDMVKQLEIIKVKSNSKLENEAKITSKEKKVPRKTKLLRLQ